jgi:hypothetical protein
VSQCNFWTTSDSKSGIITNPPPKIKVPILIKNKAKVNPNSLILAIPQKLERAKLSEGKLLKTKEKKGK